MKAHASQPHTLLKSMPAQCTVDTTLQQIDKEIIEDNKHLGGNQLPTWAASVIFSIYLSSRTAFRLDRNKTRRLILAVDSGSNQ